MADVLDLEFSVANWVNPHDVEDVAAALTTETVRAGVTQRPVEGPYGFLEWLIPTAVVVYIVKPYIQEFSKETGKLHAQSLHKGLAALWGKVFGVKPTIVATVVTAGKTPPPPVFSAAVSVKAKRRDGGTATLMFPAMTTEEEFKTGTTDFLALMERHHASNNEDSKREDPLTRAIADVPSIAGTNWGALLYWNPDGGCLELIDYIESSKRRTLIARPLASKERR